MTGIGQEPVVEHARRVLEPILARDGYELVDVEWVRGGGRWTLRVFIDREGGVNVDDCHLVSRTIDPVLDVEDFIEPAYDLEVSSPGLDRPLRTPEHFARWAGQRVLVGFRDGAVEIDVDGVVHRVPHDQIAKANLEYDSEADLRRKD